MENVMFYYLPFPLFFPARNESMRHTICDQGVVWNTSVKKICQEIIPSEPPEEEGGLDMGSMGKEHMHGYGIG